MHRLTLFLLVLACCSTGSAQQTIIIKNTDNFTRTNEQVVIKRTQLKGLEKQFSTGLLPSLLLNGKPLAGQTDDLDGDGAWDELVFVTDAAPGAQTVISVSAKSETSLPEFKSRAHAFLGKSPGRDNTFNPVNKEQLPKDHLPQAQPPLYQMEGPVWENDKGAYRLYFDVRNGKDIFSKSVSDIMMDSIGIGKGNYHAKANWGMDVLKVGESLGAGSVAFALKGADGKDMVYRLGDSVQQTQYTLVADGPVRAIIRLDYTGVNMNGTIFNARDEITIWAGSPAYQSKISVSGIKKPVKLVTGIVNLHTEKKPVQKKEAAYALLATHDKQSENKDYLGMAILVPAKQFIGFDMAPEKGAKITQTFETIIKIAENEPALYEFAALWEGRDKQYADETFFLKEIEQYARQRFNPVNIEIK